MLGEIDRKKPIPLYYQMKEVVLGQIRSGALQPGDKLATEQWYCDHFKLSRVTVRKALQELINEGAVERVRGRGPVVCRPKLNRALGQLSGVSDALSAQGCVVTSKVLAWRMVDATPEEARQLQAPEGTRVMLLERLRYSDGKPLVIQKARLRLELYDALKDTDFATASMYKTLEQHGLVLDYAEQRVSALLPDRRQQELLGVDAKTPLLYFARTAYLATGIPVEYSESWYVAAEFNVTQTLHR